MSKKTTIMFILALLLILILANTGCFESESKPGLGDYAKGYLQDSKYTRMIIEIDYVEGYEPSSQALDTLTSRVNFYCDKPEGAPIIQDGITASKSTYSDEDIKNLEKEHRDYHKGGNDIVVYILYLNGEYSEENDVLGVAFGPSSIAIFKERIDDIPIPIWAMSQVDSTDYEKSVLVHEFGHLLALVNIGYESERNHEDAYKHHCKHQECVMYHSIESASIMDLITQEDPEPPSDFCDDCKYDLSKLKSGEY